MIRTFQACESQSVERALFFQGMEGYDDIRPGSTVVAEWPSENTDADDEGIYDFEIRTSEYGADLESEDLEVDDVAADSAAITEAVVARRDGRVVRRRRGLRGRRRAERRPPDVRPRGRSVARRRDGTGPCRRRRRERGGRCFADLKGLLSRQPARGERPFFRSCALGDMRDSRSSDGWATEQSWRHGTVRASDVDLHYVTAGPVDGDLVLLLHGFPEFWYSWREQIPALAEAGYRVVAPDLRGYNRSEKPGGVGAYGLDKLVADVVGLIRSFGHESARVVGHDWGG